MVRIVFILGSSRRNGNTKKVVDQLCKGTNWTIEDLNNYNINYYDYEHHNKSDDYLKLMAKLIRNYDVFIFATPVYWYSMSGIMKVFFDRITDLLTIEKDLGRQLRGKKMGLLSCSNADDRDPSFTLPFSESAAYLGMDYIGDLHTWIKDADIDARVLERIIAFKVTLQNQELR